MPFRSFAGRFRIPIYDEIYSSLKSNEDITNKADQLEDIYYPELDDRYYLFEDFMINPIFKYSLSKIRHLVNERIQKKRASLSQEELECIIQYIFYIVYEDIDKEAHIVLVAPLEDSESVFARAKRESNESFNPVDILNILAQTQRAISVYTEKLKLYDGPEEIDGTHFKYPLLPNYPSISPRGIWRYSREIFKVSIFYPYF